MGAADSKSRDIWIRSLEEGIAFAIKSKSGGGSSSIEIMEDSSEEEDDDDDNESKEHEMRTTDREKVAVSKGGTAVRKPGKMTQVRESERKRATYMYIYICDTLLSSLSFHINTSVQTIYIYI
jgi:hypothetical protein